MRKNVFKIRGKRCLCASVLLTCFWAIGNFKASAQPDANLFKGGSDAKMPVVVPPSPNSSSLIRTVSENVDLYTGKLSVNIPIYTLKSRNVEVPISLQGNANAQRVNDVASWVGLGWHLNAGGAITRVMKNLPDEFNGTISPSFNFSGVGYLNLNTSQNGYVALGAFVPAVVPYADYSINDMKDIVNKGSWNTKNNPPSKGYDLQPDEFYFNFGSYSGKFVFDQSGQVRLITQANLFITPTISAGKITAFTVVSDNGFTYEFGNYSLNAVEESKLKTMTKTSTFTYRFTGWARNRSVTVPQGTAVVGSFLYERDPYVMSINPPSAYSPVGGGPETNYYEPGDLTDFYLSHNTNTAEYCSYASTWYLTKIKSVTGDSVMFIYADNGTQSYVVDRTVSETEPGGLTYDIIPSGPDWSFTLQPGYSFGSRYLESKTSTAANYFGAFYHHPSSGDQTFSSSEIELKSKRLKEISTSQGYKVIFTANSSRSDLVGDKSLDKISIQENGKLIKEYFFGYQTTYNGESAETVSKSVKRPRYHYNASGQFQYTTGSPYTSSYLTVVPNDARYRLFLKSVSEQGAGTERVPAYIFDYYNISGLPFRTSFRQDYYGFARNAAAQAASFTDMLSGVLKSVKYPTGGTKEFVYSLSGNTASWNGLKIDEIKEYPSAGGAPVSKLYTYGTYRATDAVVTSYQMADLYFNYIYNSTVYAAPAEDKKFFTQSRANPENLTRGTAGGYDFAEMSQPNNGKYRIEFTTNATSTAFSDVGTSTYMVSSFLGGAIPNLTSAGYKFPFPQSTSNDWRRGLPTNEYYYKSDGATKVKSIHYEYDFDNQASDVNGSAYGIQASKYRLGGGSDWNWLLYGRYSYTPYWQILSVKTERNYAPDGIAYQENKLNYSYNKVPYNGRNLLFQSGIKKEADSRGRQQVQKIKYPLDYAATTDAFGQGITFLKNKNVLSVPIEQYYYTQDPGGSNKKYISGTLNQFYSDKALPKQSFLFRPNGLPTSFTESGVVGSSFSYDANYKPEFSFTAYDVNGNSLERNKEADIQETHIWDYANTLPIAQVLNASLSQIAYTSFESDGKGGWSFTVSPGSIDQSRAITGRKSFSGTLTKTVPLGNYIVTLWTPVGTSATVNGATAATVLTKNGYQLQEWKLVNISSVTVTSSNMDEVRLYPWGAQMVTFTHDPLVGMTSQCDVDNKITYYEYDGLSRLSTVRDADKNVLKKMCYIYTDQLEECRVNTKPIYVKLMKVITYDYSEPYYSNQTADFYLKFYSDAAGTIPYTLEAPVLVDYKITSQQQSYFFGTTTYEYPATVEVPADVNEFLFTSEETINCTTGPNYYDFNCFNLDISLLLRNYTIIN